MEQRMKQLMGVLLTLALLLGLLPGSGMESARADTRISFAGTNAGDSVSATLSDDGKTLTYAGTGVVPDVNTLISACQSQSISFNKDSITTVNISHGLSAIGLEAFRDFPSLEYVTIPSSVTTIGFYAFKDCGALKEIKFPEYPNSLGVTSVGEAFEGCNIFTVEIADFHGELGTLDKLFFPENVIAYTWADDFSTVFARSYSTRNKQTIKSMTVETELKDSAESTCLTAGYKTYCTKILASYHQYFSHQTITVIDPIGPHPKNIDYVWADDYSSCSAFVSCTLCDYKDSELDHASTCVDTATCTQDGIKTYTVEFSDTIFGTATKEIPSPAHHNYNFSYTWRDNHNTCVASAVCSECQDSQEETVSSTKSGSVDCGHSGYVTYSAEFENPIFEKQTDSVFTSYYGHLTEHHDEVLPVGETAGNIEYWTCSRCGRYFTDADGDDVVSEDDVKTYNITWVLNNGSDNDVTVWRYGTVPTHSVPVKPSTATEVYPFTGWDPSPTAVNGAKTYTATYAADPVPAHTLSIAYQYADGTQAAEPHVESIPEGAIYYVDSPVIPCHTPDRATVSGTMGTTDVNVTVTYTIEAVTHTHSFTYAADGTTITASCSADECPLTNSQATLTIAAPESLTYDGTKKAAILTDDNNIKGSANIKYQKKADNNTWGDATTTAPTGAGTYKASITPGEGDGAATASVEYTVLPRSVTVSGIKAKNKFYDGTTSVSLDYSGVTFIGIVGADTLTVTADGEFAEAGAGEGKTVNLTGLILGGASAGNYSLAESGQQTTVKATISKAALTVTAKPNTITYGDAPANNGVEYSGFVNSESGSVLGGSLAYAYSYSQYGNVGDNYTITPSGLTSGNYEISFIAGTLTVGQKEVGLTWSTTPLTYNGSAQAPTAEATGLVNNDAISVTVSGGQTDAGTSYTATASALTGTKAGNYKLPAEKTTTFSIGKAASQDIEDVTDSQLYTLTSVSESVAGKMPDNAGTLTYTAGDASKTGSVTVSNFAVSETGAVTATLSDGSAGDTITLPVTIGSTNYADSTVNVVITLTAKDEAGVTISGVPTQAKTYSDADFTLTGSVTDAGTGTGVWTWSTSDDTVFQITPNGATAAVRILKAGSATITVKYESDTTVDTETTDTITVNTKTITITAKDQNIFVGGAVPTLEGADFYTVTGLVGEETLITNPTLTYQKNDEAVIPDNTTTGTYDIVPSGASAGNNYSISYTNGTLTITDKSIQTISAADMTATYGDTGVKIEATTSGDGGLSYAVTSGDAVTVNETTGVLTIVKAGSAVITVTAAETDNYARATKEVTVTIGLAPLTITVKNQEYTYNGQPQGEADPVYADSDVIAAKVEVSGLQGNDTLTSITLTGIKTEVGVYENGIELTGCLINNDTTATANYNITNNPGKLTIKPKPVTATVHAVNRDYKAGDKTVSLTEGSVSGVLDGDTVTVDVSEATGTIADANAGENKAVTVTGVKLAGTSAGKYELSEQPTGVTVTINRIANPATVAETAAVTRGGNTVDLSGSVAMNGATGAVSYAISGEANGCKLEGSILTSGANAGTVTVTVTVAEEQNYLSMTKDIIVTINEKQAQTVSFAEEALTKTYGDADFTNKATTTGDGQISYEVTAGSDVATVDAGTGLVHILKAGQATIKATAAETETYNAASAAFTLTVNKAASAVTPPTAKYMTYTGSAQELVNAGSVTGGTMYYAVTTENTAPADNLYTTSIPAKTDVGTYYAWYKVVGDDNHNDTGAAYVTVRILAPISAVVTFKVVNGSWNEGEGEAATADRVVTLTGYEGDTLKLKAADIPAVGSKPNDTYKAGSWDVTPSTDTAITEATTYTYTYAQKASISQTVTFKVVNGSWNEGEGEAATADRVVTLTGYEGDTLKLKAADIPAVGSKPNDTFKAGSWDVTPSTDTAITEATTYTYTYAQKASISHTVTFKVVNGAWGDGTREDKTVILTGYEGDELRLAVSDIPKVTKPDEGYEFGTGSWSPEEPPIMIGDVALGDPITEDTTFTYTYAEKKKISATVTFKVVNGAWGDGTREDKTVVLTGYEGDELRLEVDDIPDVTKPDEGYSYATGTWTPEEPPVNFEGMGMGDPITQDTTFTFTYGAKKKISVKVTFKVVNGKWDDKTSKAKTVTVTGYEGDQLKLTAEQIPAVGNQPKTNYKAGSWDVKPTEKRVLTENTTYTYTYQRETIQARVCFKVKNGSWDDGTTGMKTVILTGYKGQTLKLAKDQIPAVGRQPKANYKAGSWDVTPSVKTAITGKTVYTYTYAKIETCEVSFKANGGSGTMETVKVEKGTKYTLPACGFTAPDGKMFSKWDKGAPGKKITITGDTVITAQWKKIPVKPDVTILPRLVVSKKDPTQLNLSWNKVSGANGYDIYFSVCGKKLTVIDSVTGLKYQFKGLKLKKYYMASVQAYKTVMVDGKETKQNIGAASPVVHAITGGTSSKMTNPDTITVKQTKVELKLGKTCTIEAAVTGVTAGMPILDHSGLIRYYSSNRNIATVKKGVITPRNAGTCTIYVVASNGIRTKIEVTVTR